MPLSVAAFGSAPASSRTLTVAMLPADASWCKSVMLAAFPLAHPGPQEIDRVRAKYFAADDVHPVTDLADPEASGVPFLDRFQPTRSVPQHAAHELAVEIHLGQPHVFHIGSISA